MKVLVIPEDPTYDQYILKPIVERIFTDLDRSARVEVLQDPHLRGIGDALDPQIVQEIVADNPMVDLFILMVDRDCNRYKNETKAIARKEEHPERLLACLAIEEVEVWMLWLHRDHLNAPWQEVRQHCDPKEEYAEPFLRSQGWTSRVGNGRKRAMRALGAAWDGLKKACPELAKLRDEVEEWLSRRA
jgi:hypothetical protein